MKYKVVTATGTYAAVVASQLETEVNKLLKKGWKLHGGIATVIEEGSYCKSSCLIQAMVLEDTKSTKESKVADKD